MKSQVLPSNHPLIFKRNAYHFIKTLTKSHNSFLKIKATKSDAIILGESVRSDFPLLDQKVHDKDLIYFDNAATTQKPTAVLNTLNNYYTKINSNVHRGIHYLSAEATMAYENARKKVADFIGAKDAREVVFVRNASEALNLVAYSWALQNLMEGDEIILSVAEHHSNIVPWQIVAQKTGAILKYVNLTQDNEEFDLNHYKTLLSKKTKLVTTFHVSNVLASISPISEITELAKEHGAYTLLDCCQSIPNRPIKVNELGADWIVASGHKMCAPTGCGFLWSKFEILDKMMVPFLGGGEMIQDVFLTHSTYAEPPAKFEAGTPAIAEAIGLGQACEYLSKIGMHNILSYEETIGNYLYDKLNEINGLRIYGPKPEIGRAALCAFNVENIHPTDLSLTLDYKGVAIRSGHHCAQPLHKYLNTSASARASLYFYNTKSEIDVFCEALKDAIKFFKM